MVKPIRGLASSTPSLAYDTTSGEIFYTTSSRRYKTDILDVAEAAAAEIWKLRPVSYQAIDDGPDGPRQYGFIAEEVAEVDPTLCFWGRNETTGEEIVLGVQYDRVVPLLLQETRRLKEAANLQNQKLEAQAQAIQAMLQRLAVLEGREIWSV